MVYTGVPGTSAPEDTVFLNTSNEQSENDIKKAIPSITEWQRIKYLGINLTKKVQSFHSENYKTSLKELKEA